MYVVLEAQYQSSLAAAVNRINAGRDEVCVEIVGYLLEELRDAKNFEAFKKVRVGVWAYVWVRVWGCGGGRDAGGVEGGRAVGGDAEAPAAPPTHPLTPPHTPHTRAQDVANANIFIGSLIFIEELAEKIVEAVGVRGGGGSTSVCALCVYVCGGVRGTSSSPPAARAPPQERSPSPARPPTPCLPPHPAPLHARAARARQPGRLPGLPLHASGDEAEQAGHLLHVSAGPGGWVN